MDRKMGIPYPYYSITIKFQFGILGKLRKMESSGIYDGLMANFRFVLKPFNPFLCFVKKT